MRGTEGWLQNNQNAMQKAIEHVAKQYKKEVVKFEPTLTSPLLRDLLLGSNHFLTITTCRKCKGKGKLKKGHLKKKPKCPVCKGYGKEISYTLPETLEYARRLEYGLRG